MNPLKLAVARPVTVTVGVILVVMFGLIGLGAIPVQLTPAVDQPEITVSTSWAGRTPGEIVDEITREQEKQLKNVENLKSMRSVSREGSVDVTLEFYIGTDISRALQEVSDKLRQVPEYPEDADEPRVEASSGAAENAIAWVIFELDPAKSDEHPGFDISTLFTAMDDEVRPFIERIAGVAEVNIYGGREQEMRVLVDTERLAQRGLTHLDLIAALRAENENVSAGTIAEGKRDYRVRVVGQFAGERDILDTIVAYRENGPVYVRDVADVELGYEKARGFVRSFGHAALAMNVIRQNNANVMDIMDELKLRLAEVESDILPNLHPTAGPDLRLRHVYDETIYITSAIDLVTQNLWVGGGIAVVVLMIFLRSFVATGVIALAIPISVIGTFLVLLALGRSLNVVSLAGLAFAVGMVVDNAIVVLENIDRHRNMGKPPLLAAYEGGKEVWGAILASTLTTVAVFIPILTIQEEAGQLFRDISIAIVAAVSLSLVVSTTVIPAATSRWFGRRDPGAKPRGIRGAFASLFGVAPLFAKLVSGFSALVHWLITGWRAWTLRPAVIVAMTGASVGAAALLMPPLDYLPAGNRNLVFGGLLIPPGYSVEQKELIATRLEAELLPYARATADDPSSYEGLPPIPRMGGEPYDPVPVDNFFIGAFNGGMFSGATSEIEEVVLPVGQLLTNAFNTIPDAFGGARQTSLFGRGVGGGNTIDVEISGPDLARVKAAASTVFDSLTAAPEYGFQRVRPDPGNFNIQQDEFQVRLSRLGVELGLRTDAVGTAVRGLFDGAFAGEFRTGRDAIDIRLLPEGGRLRFKEQLADVPVATPRGPVVPLDALVDVVPAKAPQEIQRIEELPSVTIRVTPPEGEPLEDVMRDIRENHLAAAYDAGQIDRTMRVRLEGTAAKLDEVQTALLGKASGEPMAAWQRGGLGLAALIVLVSLAVGAFALARAVRNKRGVFVYAALGALTVGVALASIVALFAAGPHLATARFVWALAVTYLLMCALFESFTYPFVIMFSVPLAVVGGFVGLGIVHRITAANPLIATQNLDVLTMLGFVILIGVVVNNAILLVHQSLNLMTGHADTRSSHHDRMSPMAAIAEAVRTRTRPVTMSTLTSVGGMMPLVLFPGAGSELYRGLGSVVVGGLLVSTFFTLLLVPLVLSIVVQMSAGLRALREPAGSHDVAALAVPERMTSRDFDRLFATAETGEPDAPARSRSAESEPEPEPVAGNGSPRGHALRDPDPPRPST